jgi:hypothetical protein
MLSRRRLLASLGGAVVAMGCKRGFGPPVTCDETKGLSPEERGARSALRYADRSPDPKKACEACTQWVPESQEGSCGGCKLLKGPIHPGGTCRAFAPKA